jgi:hypothetical protein
MKSMSELTAGTLIHDISTTVFSDSKVKIKKQGGFFVTLIDCIFKQSSKTKTYPKTTNSTAHSAVPILNTKALKRK